MTRIRVAICGAGIGAEHLQGYLANPDLFDVVCIADLDATRAKSLTTIAHCDYENSAAAAIARNDVDLVDICLPPSLHKGALLTALAADKHVICEKPLVPSLSDWDDVIAAEATSAGRVMPVFQYRFGNGLSQLQALIKSGLTGKPLVATLETHWKRDAQYYAVDWRGKWATELGGAIVGHAIHAHDLLLQIMGPVADVYARLATRVNSIEVEDCASLVLTMSSGALVTSSVTLGSATDQSRLRFCFSNLTAQSALAAYNPGQAPWQFIAHEPAIQQQVDAAINQLESHREGFARQFELAHAALTTHTELPVSMLDARASLELITGIYQSSRSGGPVQLPLRSESPGYCGWVPIH